MVCICRISAFAFCIYYFPSDYFQFSVLFFACFRISSCSSSMLLTYRSALLMFLLFPLLFFISMVSFDLYHLTFWNNVLVFTAELVVLHFSLFTYHFYLLSPFCHSSHFSLFSIISFKWKYLLPTFQFPKIHIFKNYAFWNIIIIFLFYNRFFFTFHSPLFFHT